MNRIGKSKIGKSKIEPITQTFPPLIIMPGEGEEWRKEFLQGALEMTNIEIAGQPGVNRSNVAFGIFAHRDDYLDWRSKADSLHRSIDVKLSSSLLCSFIALVV